MTPGVTSTSQDVYQLHMLILWICVVIGVLVFGAMAYAMFKFRKSQGRGAGAVQPQHQAEVIWTVIPDPDPGRHGVARHQDPDQACTTPRDAEMTVKITGYQWMWRYEYLGRGREVHQPPGPRKPTKRARAGMIPTTVEIRTTCWTSINPAGAARPTPRSAS
jgi:cytochrome c oxidase subunit 2